ncbi:MAG: putative O-glycosylation ligase, exosortase A system-associated [Colwellia sp.]|nr:putative O-glycosylation ligase, exosortase A system-associated [Colwellia sp.]
MRDILLVLFLFVAIFYSFKKPYLGVSAWIWVALMAPANWAFGFSQSFRINLTIVIVTAISYVVFKEKNKVPFDKLSAYISIFLIWSLITTANHIQLVNADVWDDFFQFVKIILLYFFILATISKRLHIDTFIWAIVLAISSYAAMEAVKYIISAGGHRITGRSGIIMDRNDLAVAINMCIPLCVYLLSVTKVKALKIGLIALIVLSIISVVGTYSRGGFIGLSILAIAFWLKSNRKMLFALLAFLMLPILYQNAPAEWKERQDTISTAAEQDGSFIGRLWAWKISTMIALDNPMTGGGYRSVTDPLLWRYYRPMTPDFGPIATPEIPNRKGAKAAHNIYFQVLGDHGFVGLLIFLTLLSSAYLKCRQNIILSIKLKIAWQEKLNRALSLSLIGYGITGLNVSLAYFELVYALIAIIVVNSSYIKRVQINTPLNLPS